MGDRAFIKLNQFEDWQKLLFHHPEPVWSGDVTSRNAIWELRGIGLCKELEDGWHLTEKAVTLVRKGDVFLK